MGETAAGRLGNAGRRDVAQRREQACSAAPETLLEGLPQVLANPVQLNLGVSVVHHAHQVVRGPFHLAEDRVEEVVIVTGEENTVRILVKEAPVVAEGVVLHPEAGLHGHEDGVHVHLLLVGIPQRALIRRKTQVQRPQIDTVRRGYQPQHPQQGHHAHNKCQYFLCLHRSAKVRKFYEIPRDRA